MQSSTLVIFFLVGIVSCVLSLAVPTLEEVRESSLAADLEAIDQNIKNVVGFERELHSRQKRATCGLWRLQHTACAAHCILLRAKGGYCDSKNICRCRYD